MRITHRRLTGREIPPPLNNATQWDDLAAHRKRKCAKDVRHAPCGRAFRAPMTLEGRGGGGDRARSAGRCNAMTGVMPAGDIALFRAPL